MSAFKGAGGREERERKGLEDGKEAERTTTVDQHEENEKSKTFFSGRGVVVRGGDDAVSRRAEEQRLRREEVLEGGSGVGEVRGAEEENAEAKKHDKLPFAKTYESSTREGVGGKYVANVKQQLFV